MMKVCSGFKKNISPPFHTIVAHRSSSFSSGKQLSTKNVLKPNIAGGVSEREPDKAASEEQEENGGREGDGREKNEKRNRAKSHLEGDRISGVVKEVTEDET